MADYTNSKSGPGGVFPDNATETTWNRLEPLITAEQVRYRHLFGIPLVSAMKDPLTGKAQVMTDDLIKDTIDRSISMAESDTGLDIFPIRQKEKHPFDRNEFNSFGYFRVEHRPVATIDKVTMTPSNNVDIYSVPLEWVETAYLPRGQINIIPLFAATGYNSPVATGNVGAAFLAVLGSHQWVPAFWQIEYTSGFPDGLLPKIVNELIGTIAAMEVLGLLAATYAKSSSHSLGIDGMSQSVSTPGPALFDQRIGLLADKRKMLAKKLKTQYGLNLFSSNV